MGIIFLYGHRIIYILVGFYYRNPRARSQAGDFFDPRLSELCISVLEECSGITILAYSDAVYLLKTS